MAKEEELKFSIDVQKWFRDIWGFTPSPEQLEILFKIEPGTYDLFRKIFSYRYMSYEQLKEMRSVTKK